jgi:hypothetical protein
MASLVTEQLECLLDCVIPNSVRVLGVFPANCVPMRRVVQTAAGLVQQLALRSNLGTPMERHPSLDTAHHYCFILNTHTNREPGEHWLAFFYNGDTHNLEYFDSFGFPLSMYANVKVALDSCNLLSLCVRANSHMLQAITSTVCGHYCIAFLYWRARNLGTSASNFAHAIMSEYATAEDRDKLIVSRLRAVTFRHPCCAGQLFGHGGSSSASCVTRFSQSCCCRANCRI